MICSLVVTLTLISGICVVYILNGQTPSDECLYIDGTTHAKGSLWYDGCDYSCTCIDPAKNFYNCTSRCKAYSNLPPICTLKPDPNDQCCKVPDCGTFNPLKGNTTTGTQAPGQLSITPNGTHTVFSGSSQSPTPIQGIKAGITSAPTCVDKDPASCDTLGPDVCTIPAFKQFAKEHCEARCGLCPNPTGSPQPIGKGGNKSSMCVDKDYASCEILGFDVCTTPAFNQFAQENCAATCGFCKLGDGCYYKGKVYNQSQTWQDGCDTNCTCNDEKSGNYTCKHLCPVYQHLPQSCRIMKLAGECCGHVCCTDCGYTFKAVTPHPGKCYYKEKYYKQNETWIDDCQYKCTCLVANQGFYRCRELCVNWNLPSVCLLNDPKSGKCCKTPWCPPWGITIQYPDGYKEE